MFRLWHPLRDPHHCTFRILILLRISQKNMQSQPRLSMLDMFYLFPELISDISMSKDMRTIFSRLGFPKKKDSFVNLPSIQLIYREIQLYQKIALRRLVARNLLADAAYKEGKAKLIINNIPPKLLVHVDDRIEKSRDKILFIVNKIGSLPIDGKGSLLRQSGLEMGGRL